MQALSFNALTIQHQQLATHYISLNPHHQPLTEHNPQYITQKPERRTQHQTPTTYCLPATTHCPLHTTHRPPPTTKLLSLRRQLYSRGVGAHIHSRQVARRSHETSTQSDRPDLSRHYLPETTGECVLPCSLLVILQHRSSPGFRQGSMTGDRETCRDNLQRCQLLTALQPITITYRIPRTARQLTANYFYMIAVGHAIYTHVIDKFILMPLLLLWLHGKVKYLLYYGK